MANTDNGSTTTSNEASAVYVDTSAMTAWETKMKSINDDCVSDIEKIVSSIESLNSYFQGAYAESYEESFGNFTDKVKASHQALADFSGFLDTISEYMQNS